MVDLYLRRIVLFFLSGAIDFRELIGPLDGGAAFFVPQASKFRRNERRKRRTFLGVEIVDVEEDPPLPHNVVGENLQHNEDELIEVVGIISYIEGPKEVNVGNKYDLFNDRLYLPFGANFNDERIPLIDIPQLHTGGENKYSRCPSFKEFIKGRMTSSMRKRDLYYAGFVAVVYYLVGVSAFLDHSEYYNKLKDQKEKLGWIDAFYFVTVTFSTVGYGDITPASPPTKIFTVILALTGIIVVVSYEDEGGRDENTKVIVNPIRGSSKIDEDRSLENVGDLPFFIDVGSEDNRCRL